MNKIYLTIAEPWNFESDAGANKLMLEVIKKSSNKIYCKSVSRFENMTKYLLLIERDAYGNYNVYKSKDYNFNEIDLEFAMIGAISGS